MKKINLLAVVVAGVFAVACNGGGSSNNSGSGGGSTSDACANGAATCGAPAGSVPTVYSQVITPLTLNSSSLSKAQLDGTLSSTTNLYLSSAESYPLIFTVTGNTVDITVDFTIVADDANIPAGSPLPTMTPHQCVFTVANPAACNLSITLGDAPVGKYKVIPHVIGATEFAGVEMNFQAPTQFTLPLGTYLMGGQTLSYGSDSSGEITDCRVYNYPEGGLLVNTLTGGYFCLNNECFPTSGLMTQNRFPTVTLPSDVTNIPADLAHNMPARIQYLSNAGWNNNVFLSTEAMSPSACRGLLATGTMTLQSSSTTPPYPVVVPTTLKTKSADKTITSLLGGIAQ